MALIAQAACPPDLERELIQEGVCVTAELRDICGGRGSLRCRAAAQLFYRERVRGDLDAPRPAGSDPAPPSRGARFALCGSSLLYGDDWARGRGTGVGVHEELEEQERAVPPEPAAQPPDPGPEVLEAGPPISGRLLHRRDLDLVAPSHEEARRVARRTPCMPPTLHMKRE